MSHESESNFPIDVKSPLLFWVQKLILFSIKVLAFFMGLVILWSVIDVGFIIYSKVATPPYLLLNIDDILSVLGAFLVVLIAIEIFINIILYLKRDVIHLRLVIATALMAIARKVIIIDYHEISSSYLYAIAAIIAALGIAYWLVHLTCVKSGPDKP